MPIATKGAFKHLTAGEVESFGAQAVMCNAFVLSLKPGLETISAHGGLHKFMKWNHAVFTDSGGFQMILPSFFIKTTEEGIWFKNPFDGTKLFATPESVAGIQQVLGSDVAMMLDCQPPFGSAPETVVDYVKKTHAWAERFLKVPAVDGQLKFGISQGGCDLDLRKKSTSFINSLPFDGVAIGGLGIGEGSQMLKDVLEVSVPLVDKSKPRYVMGVGSPVDMVNAIGQGVDVFDSCYPTKNARHNELFTSEGTIDISKQQFHADLKPLDEECDCHTCATYTRSYLHHLARTKEVMSERLNTIHNVHFVLQLMRDTRVAIREGRFAQFKQEQVALYAD